MKVSLGALIEKNKLVILMVEIVVLIGLLLPPSLFHSFGCKSTPAFRANYQSSNGFFIDNQVIVVGIGNDIDKAVNAAEDHLKISLDLAENCNLSYLNTRGFKWFGKIPIIGVLFRNQTVTQRRDEMLIFIT